LSTGTLGHKIVGLVQECKVDDNTAVGTADMRICRQPFFSDNITFFLWKVKTTGYGTPFAMDKSISVLVPYPEVRIQQATSVNNSHGSVPSE
jgi:hypothetical protein